MDPSHSLYRFTELEQRNRSHALYTDDLSGLRQVHGKRGGSDQRACQASERKGKEMNALQAIIDRNHLRCLAAAEIDQTVHCVIQRDDVPEEPIKRAYLGARVRRVEISTDWGLKVDHDIIPHQKELGVLLAHGCDWEPEPVTLEEFGDLRRKVVAVPCREANPWVCGPLPTAVGMVWSFEVEVLPQ